MQSLPLFADTRGNGVVVNFSVKFIYEIEILNHFQ